MNEHQEEWTAPGTTDANGGSGGMKDQVKEKAHQASEKAKETAHQAKDKIQSEARHAMSEARDRAQGYTEGQKTHAAERVEGYGSAAHHAADDLRDEGDPNIARYVDAVAARLDSAASYLRNRDVKGLLRDAEDMARKRPEVVFTGLFLAGVTVARFLKASSSPQAPIEEDEMDYEYEPDHYASAPAASEPSGAPSPEFASAGQGTGEAMPGATAGTTPQ